MRETQPPPILINDIRMDVSIVAVASPEQEEKIEGYLSKPNTLHLATMLTLNTSDGHAIAFVNDFRSNLGIQKLSDGSYEIALSYEPENKTEIVGQDISLLKSVSTLGVRYAGVLKAIGLQIDSARISDFTLELNGRVAMTKPLGKLTTTSPGEFQFFDISSDFNNAGGIARPR